MPSPANPGDRDPHGPGAEREHILRMVLARTLMSLAGISIGLVVALGLARLIASPSSDSAADPPTFRWCRSCWPRSRPGLPAGPWHARPDGARYRRRPGQRGVLLQSVRKRKHRSISPGRSLALQVLSLLGAGGWGKSIAPVTPVSADVAIKVIHAERMADGRPALRFVGGRAASPSTIPTSSPFRSIVDGIDFIVMGTCQVRPSTR
jgi:hypothetical protein